MLTGAGAAVGAAVDWHDPSLGGLFCMPARSPEKFEKFGHQQQFEEELRASVEVVCSIALLLINATTT